VILENDGQIQLLSSLKVIEPSFAVKEIHLLRDLNVNV